MEFDATGDMTAWVGIAYTAITALVGWILKQGASHREELARLAEKIANDKAENQAKLQDLELRLATSYHNKDAFDDILDMKLKPILDILVDIKTDMRHLQARHG